MLMHTNTRSCKYEQERFENSTPRKTSTLLELAGHCPFPTNQKCLLCLGVHSYQTCTHIMTISFHLLTSTTAW